MYSYSLDHNPEPAMHALDHSESDDDSDMLSDFSYSAASSATSYDVSMRSASPAPSQYSVTSSIRAQSYRLEFGRGLNNHSDVYQLPADDEELARLGTLDRTPALSVHPR